MSFEPWLEYANSCHHEKWFEGSWHHKGTMILKWKCIMNPHYPKQLAEMREHSSYSTLFNTLLISLYVFSISRCEIVFTDAYSTIRKATGSAPKIMRVARRDRQQMPKLRRVSHSGILRRTIQMKTGHVMHKTLYRTWPTVSRSHCRGRRLSFQHQIQERDNKARMQDEIDKQVARLLQLHGLKPLNASSTVARIQTLWSSGCLCVLNELLIPK